MMFHIKINSDEENKDNGFTSLMASGATITFLKDDEYLVPEKAKKKLDEDDVQWEPVPTKEEAIKTKEKDASKIQD